VAPGFAATIAAYVTDDLADTMKAATIIRRFAGLLGKSQGPFPAQSSRMRTDVPPPGQAFDGLCEALDGDVGNG
jgi:hypothetical protein